jgi:acyl carrier protein
MQKLYEIIIRIKLESGGEVITELSPSTDLRRDLAFSSLDLATLTAEIEDEFNVDIFENGFVYTVEDIIKKIPHENH